VPDPAADRYGLRLLGMPWWHTIAVALSACVVGLAVALHFQHVPEGARPPARLGLGGLIALLVIFGFWIGVPMEAGTPPRWPFQRPAAQRRFLIGAALTPATLGVLKAAVLGLVRLRYGALAVRPGWLVLLAGLVLLLALAGALSCAWIRRRHRAMRLRERLCDACGYCLRGVHGASCPECGAPRTDLLVRVSSAADV
jgi:hypothetical protein